MYGAMLGDMIGAPCEEDRRRKTRDFSLFIGEGPFRRDFTDDTVMTVAVADALMNSLGKSEEETKRALVRSMRAWTRRYPGAGYGRMLCDWLRSCHPSPSERYGDGSAMHVSSAGWLYDTLEETRQKARWTAEVAHSHPEGIRDAEAVASVIFLARLGWSKADIRSFLIHIFGYDLSLTCDQIRTASRHEDSCPKTVPEAMEAFLEGENIEDVIRTAVSLGGDSASLACMAGSMAEAFYGVPPSLETMCRARIPKDMRAVLARLCRMRGRKKEPRDLRLEENMSIEKAIEAYVANSTWDTVADVLEAIRTRMRAGGCFLIPVIVPEEPLERLDPELFRAGETYHAQTELHFRAKKVTEGDGGTWMLGLTTRGQSRNCGTIATACLGMEETLRSVLREEGLAGILLNPCGKSFMLSRQLIGMIFEADREKNHILFSVGDITALDVEAIVSAANPSLLGGGGVDGAIHRSAGPDLLRACRKLKGCAPGQAKITQGYRLRAKYVIHTVGPVYQGESAMNAPVLHACYTNALELAKAHDLHSIAFPAIATGACGYPAAEAAMVALRAVSEWLGRYPDYGMTVTLCCHDQAMRACYARVISGAGCNPRHPS